jgi:hypothetical protein
VQYDRHWNLRRVLRIGGGAGTTGDKRSSTARPAKAVIFHAGREPHHVGIQPAGGRAQRRGSDASGAANTPPLSTRYTAGLARLAASILRTSSRSRAVAVALASGSPARAPAPGTRLALDLIERWRHKAAHRDLRHATRPTLRGVMQCRLHVVRRCSVLNSRSALPAAFKTTTSNVFTFQECSSKRLSTKPLKPKPATRLGANRARTRLPAVHSGNSGDTSYDTGHFARENQSIGSPATSPTAWERSQRVALEAQSL